MTGYDHPGEAIGPEPSTRSPECRAAWHTAFAVMAQVQGSACANKIWLASLIAARRVQPSGRTRQMLVPPGWPDKLVLASESPRRLQLLASMGLEIKISPAKIDETPIAGESPIDYVRRLARNKALAIPWTDAPILGADTVVSLDGQILGKPSDSGDALQMLLRLSGRTHQVHTAVALRRQEDVCVVAASSEVVFLSVTKDVLEWYVSTNEPLGKAGGYGIQGIGSMLVSEIRGSLTNVIGLPMAEVHLLLSRTASPDVRSAAARR